MVNYQDGKIYKLVSFQTDKVYIGSTCQGLAVRKAEHKRHLKSYKNGKKNYITAFELIKYEDVEIILIENFPCNTKEELYSRERIHIENNNCINKAIPTRTKKEYKLANKEKIQQYDDDYHQKNKQFISERQKKYYLANKEKILARNEKYRQANREKENERCRKRYRLKKQQANDI